MVANESSMTSPSCANSHLDFSISEDRTAKSPILDSSTAGKMSLFSRISTKAGFKMSNHIVVTVQLLNAEATIQHEFKKSATGKDVLDWVCGHLDIVEKYFFGLRFFDDKKNRFWIDLHKNLGKQFDEKRVMLCFRVRFYPPAPTELKEEITRYHIFLQICRDLLHGRLCCPSTLSAKLGGLILQATLGDFDQKIHSGNYVSQYRLVVKQTESLENKIQDYHKSFVGYTPAKCEIDLLVLVCQLETYGFDPYTVQFKNSHNEQTYIGATPKGVLIFEGHEVKHVLLWNDIDKTTFFGREYKIVVTNEYARRHIDLCEKSSSLKSSSLSRANSGLEINHHNVIKAKCCKRDFCKHLWQHILAQKAFYTAETAIAVKPIFSKPFIPLFTRGSTFRSQTSKTYHEFEQEEPTREQPTHFFRCQLQKHKSRDDNQLSNPEYDLLVKEHKKSVEDAIREKSVDDLLNEQPKKEEELARSEEEDIPDTHNLTLESIKEETSSKSFVTTEPIVAENNNSITLESIKIEQTSIEFSRRISRDNTSTPIQEEIISQMTSKSLTNSVFGQTFCDAKDVTRRVSEQARTPSQSLPKKVFRFILTGLLIFLLVLSIVVTIFETKATKSNGLRSLPMIRNFEYDIYRPARHSVLGAYNSIIHRH